MPFAVDDNVNRPLSETGGFDAGDEALRRQASGDLLPISTLVLCDLDITVVGPGVDQASLERGLRNGPDGGIGDVSLFLGS